MKLFLHHTQPPVAAAMAETLRQLLPGTDIRTDGKATTDELAVMLDDSVAAGEEDFRWPHAATRLTDAVHQLERHWQKLQALQTVEFPQGVLDVIGRVLVPHGQAPVDLTEKEVALLVYLWQRDLPASREELLRDVWQYAPDTETHTIETHIHRLRQKIERDPNTPELLITTKQGYTVSRI